LTMTLTFSGLIIYLELTISSAEAFQWIAYRYIYLAWIEAAGMKQTLVLIIGFGA